MFKIRHVLGALAALVFAVAPAATAQTPDGVFGPGGSRFGRDGGGRWHERGMQGRWNRMDGARMGGAWRQEWRGARFERSGRWSAMRDRTMERQRHHANRFEQRYRANRFEQRHQSQWNRQRMRHRMQEHQQWRQQRRHEVI